VSTKVSYIVQEATVVIRNIFRKYPNQYESIISTLCENLDSLDEPEAKAAMIWVIGQYADRIEDSDVLLEDFLDTFQEETHEVQLALLTATVKLFIQRPTRGSTLVPKVLKWATEETDNPDLRDRGYMYWRLLSSAPEEAKKVVMGEKPPITAEESEKLDPGTLEESTSNPSIKSSAAQDHANYKSRLPYNATSCPQSRPPSWCANVRRPIDHGWIRAARMVTGRRTVWLLLSVTRTCTLLV
jgi:AP-2 complex subunit beta-1